MNIYIWWIVGSQGLQWSRQIANRYCRLRGRPEIAGTLLLSFSFENWYAVKQAVADGLFVDIANVNNRVA
jgi:hypothetical protein